MGEEQKLLEVRQPKPVPAEAELLPRTEVCNISNPLSRHFHGSLTLSVKKGFLVLG